MKRRPAFTLVELLITAVLFVVVAGYAVVILTTTVALTQQVDRSNGAATETQQVIRDIGHAFTYSAALSPLVTLTTGDPESDQSVLILTVMSPDNQGRITGNTELRAYCPVTISPGKRRLAEFVITGGSYSGGAGTTSATCSVTGLSVVFSAGSVINNPLFLTDSNTNVLRFEALDVHYSNYPPNPMPPGLRLTLTTLYDPTVTNATATDRADSGAAPLPVTVQTVVTRSNPGAVAPYDILPFNGL